MPKPIPTEVRHEIRVRANTEKEAEIAEWAFLKGVHAGRLYSEMGGRRLKKTRRTLVSQPTMMHKRREALREHFAGQKVPKGDVCAYLVRQGWVGNLASAYASLKRTYLGPLIEEGYVRIGNGREPIQFYKRRRKNA